MGFRFTQDFCFGLEPILDITASNSAVADVDFLRASANGFVPVWINRRRDGRVFGMGHGFHKDALQFVRVRPALARRLPSVMVFGQNPRQSTEHLTEGRSCETKLGIGLKTAW
jgi:hypothetical protein